MNILIKRAGLLVGLCLIAISTTLTPILSNEIDAVGAVPQGTEERGIWINQFEIVLYNNVLRREKVDQDLSDGNSYEVWSGGEVFTNTDFTELGNNERDFILDREDPLSIGGEYRNEDGCATLSFSGTGRSTGTLRSSCDGNSISTSVTMERTELSSVQGYLNGDQVYLPLYVGSISGIPDDPEEGKDVNGRFQYEDNFIKTDGVDPGNTGYAKREYVDCANGECFGKQGEGKKPGEQNATWVVTDGRGDNPDLFQVRRQDGGGWCQGDCSATTVMKLSGAKDKQYDRDEQIEAAQRFQNSNAKRIAFRDFFNNPDNAAKARLCSSLLTRSFSVEYTIDTLVKPIPGPYLDCLKNDAFGDDQLFDEINSIEGRAVDAPEYLNTAAEDSCSSGGIPIISDLACGIVKWLFNTIFEAFTAVIGWLAQPPDMFSEQNSTLEQSMSNLRNIANVLFVIAFLVLVFQYLTNINVADAYFIKKFVPRLVIAVILVQASFWVTAELNYFFYDLGRSVQSIVFFGQQPGDLQIGNGAATLALFPGPFLGMALILGLLMLIVLLITFVVLAIRYVLIIVLAIFAPLAFASIAIPQLEGVTKKWFKMYVQLLLMYPIIMFFIAASSIVGGVFSGGGFVLQIMGLIVQILPFIILPFTFKFAGGMMGNISGKLMSKASGLAKNKGKEAYGNSQFGMRRAKEKEFKKGLKSDRATRDAASRVSDKINKPMNRYSRMRTFGAGADAATIDRNARKFADQQAKQKQEDANAVVSSGVRDAVNKGWTDPAGTKHDPGRDAALAFAEHQAINSTDENVRSAAMQHLVGEKAEDNLENVRTALVGSGEAGRQSWNRMVGENYGDINEMRTDLGYEVKPGTGVGQLSAEGAKNFFKATDEKKAGQKVGTWKTAAKHDALKTMSEFDRISKGGGNAAAKLTAKPDVAKAVVDSINANPAQVSGASLDELKGASTALQASHREMQSDPTANPAEVANIDAAIRRIQNEIGGR